MSYDPEQITFFAQTDARGASVAFGIKAKDRTRHVYVIGKTGMGKSTLLENMAIQDIKNGNGLAFIDPHGQTAETLLDYIPESRKDDVLYFAPFDTDNPVAFNVMEDVEPDRRHLVVSGLMSVFKKIFVDAWSARMEYILSNTIMALLEYPGSTLLGVNRMLSDKEYRKKVIDNIKDPSVRSFWVDEFLKYNERYMQEAGDAIKNKIGQFTANPIIRNIIGQPKSSFDIREMMDKKKIIIMNLSKGLIGESNANLLGSMLTTRIYLAAMSRADMAQSEMKDAPNFYFYVDEFQSFANATFANILSEARKYKLNLTIAHQYIEQMEEEVRDAVFGNVGTTIAFRVGPFDAEVLETIFSPKFLAPDIVNLGFAQIYLTLMIDGIGSQPFSATTLLPIKPASISCKEMVIHRSREQFSHPRPEVEKAILEWHGSQEVKSQVKTTEIPVEKKVEHTAFENRPTVAKPIPEKSEKPKTSPAVVHKYEAKKFERPKEEKPFIAKKMESKPDQKEYVKKDSTPPKAVYVPPSRQQPIVDQKGQKNLEDLRAVLRTISKNQSTEAVVSDDTSPKIDTIKKGEKAPEETILPPHQTPPLRTALASLVAEESMSKQVVPAPVAPHTVPVTLAKVSAFEHVSPPQKSEFHPRSVIEKESQEEQDYTLSPKKLERMMRVTRSDKSPLG